MRGKLELCIDVDAAKALIHWKSVFVEEVAARARELTAASSEPNRVTLSAYRQAAQFAVRSLSAAILDEGPISDNKAA